MNGVGASAGGVDSERSRGGLIEEEGTGSAAEGALSAETSMSLPSAFEMALKSKPAVGGSLETGLGAISGSAVGNGALSSPPVFASVETLGVKPEDKAGPGSRGGRSSS